MVKGIILNNPFGNQQTYLDKKLERSVETYAPRSPQRTFGHDVVLLSAHQIAGLESMATFEQDDDEQARLGRNTHFYGETALRLAGEARDDLIRVSDDYNIIGSYFNSSLPPHLLGLVNPVSLQAEYTSDENSPKVVAEAIRNAPDDIMLNVLQWHNYVIEQQSESEEVQRAFNVHKNRFLVATHKLYEEGYFALPPKDIEGSSLVVGDIFDTTLKERGGYFRVGTSEVVVTQGKGALAEERIANLRAQFPRVLTHEFVHLFLNRSLEAPESGLTSRWFNEAMTETISRNIRREMNEQNEDDKSYFAERMLLNAVIAKSSDKVATTKFATRAFTGNEQDRKTFTLHIDKLWGARDILEKIGDALMQEELRLAEISGTKITRVIEAEALHHVRRQLKEDPETILWTTSDQILQNYSKLAQEK